MVEKLFIKRGMVNLCMNLVESSNVVGSWISLLISF